MRRSALSQLEDAVSDAVPAERTTVDIPAYIAMESPQSQGGISALEIYFYTLDSYRNFSMPETVKSIAKSGVQTVALVPAAELVCAEDKENLMTGDMMIVPYISNISKGREDDLIREHFDGITEMCKNSGIYVGNLSWVTAFRRAGTAVYGDTGLNVYNRFAEEAYGAIGVRRCTGGAETAEKAFGPYPLMISEHSPEGNFLIDRKKERIAVIRRNFSSQTVLASLDAAVDYDAVDEKLRTNSGIVRVYSL